MKVRQLLTIQGRAVCPDLHAQVTLGGVDPGRVLIESSRAPRIGDPLPEGVDGVLDGGAVTKPHAKKHLTGQR